MQWLKQEIVELWLPESDCAGAIPGRSLACLSSPLVLALQVRARCLRPAFAGAKCKQAQAACSC